MSPRDQVFLTAEWRDLVLLNYAVDPALLTDSVPRGTELDSFGGRTYVSLVGFQFRKTRLFGWLSPPFHRSFDEVNLRFYLRRKEGNEVRRGVAFLAEIVPKLAVAKIARLAYGENYICCPMKHRAERRAERKSMEYQWQWRGACCKVRADSSALPATPVEGSLEQFITEHYWGYSTHPARGTFEYQVSHERWAVRPCDTASFAGEVRDLYGAGLGQILQRRPDSAFIVDGSPVTVWRGREIQ